MTSLGRRITLKSQGLSPSQNSDQKYDVCEKGALCIEVNQMDGMPSQPSNMNSIHCAIRIRAMQEKKPLLVSSRTPTLHTLKAAAPDVSWTKLAISVGASGNFTLLAA